MTDEQRAGEVIEACTSDFVAQCYELYQTPSLGCLVKTKGEADTDLYGVVCKVLTAGIEPGRRPIARGKDELNEEEVYRASPQLFKLLRSEFNVLVVGFRDGGEVFQYLPPKPARIHSFVYPCTAEEIKQFSLHLDFLSILLNSRADVAVNELIGASLRQISQVYGADKRAFLVNAGKELAVLLSRDYSQLKTVLKGLRYDAVG